MEITPSLPQDESRKAQLNAAVISERISPCSDRGMVLMQAVPIWIALSSMVILYNSEPAFYGLLPLRMKLYLMNCLRISVH